MTPPASPPALVAVAHGSTDPRSAATVTALIGQVRARRAELTVRLGFLDLSAPRLGAVLAALSQAVVVPLLLGRAYHANVDVPAAVAEAELATPRLGVTIADVLGPDPRLEDAALHRLYEAGVEPHDPATGVVLAAAGSAHPPANEAVADVAARWARSSGWAGVAPAFACAAQPTVPAAIAQLRAAGARRIAVGAWFLAPGLLPDKVSRLARRADPEVRIAEPLGAQDRIAELVAERYECALRSPVALPA